ncbi:MAG: hypothetical protein Q7U16_01390 [Agitococcus sp.]|nr:hypothetical protein [Agitococcus sp.]
MITDIKFYDISRIKKLKRRSDTVVISVLDVSELAARPKLGGFGGVLCLQFEDTYEEGKLASPGSWPDNPTAEEHVTLAQGKGERVPTLDDANRIVGFLREQHAKNQPLKLAVHCYGGISRSAAIAQWAALYFWVPLTVLPHQSLHYANPRVTRLLDKAVNRK